MKNIVLKTILLKVLTGSIFALHGKIVFYDGTYVVGKIKQVDEATVKIVPIGLDTPEGVLVGNIDSLKMENGMVPVINSAVKYFYNNGEFVANDNDWMDEYGDFEYDEYTTLQEEYKYEKTQKTPQNYYQISISGGMPLLYSASLTEDQTTTPDNEKADGTTETFVEKLYVNLGGSVQLPYYQIGTFDISPGFRLMTFGFENSSVGAWKCFQLAGFASIDFKPIFYFLPENMHISAEAGLSYSLAYDFDNTEPYWPDAVQGEEGETYGGVGMNVGGSIDYWMQEIPLAFKLFGNLYAIPQPPPYQTKKSAYVSFGMSISVILKRHKK